MVFPSGLYLAFLALFVLFFSEKLRSFWAIFSLLLVALGQWFLPAEGTLLVDFFGYQINLFHYRPEFEIISRLLPVFGLFYFVFLVNKQRSRLFYLFALLHLSSAMFVLQSGDYMSFFVGWEMMTLTAAVLMFVEGKIKVARTYLIFHIGGGICLLTAAGLVYGLSGHLELLADISQNIAAVPFLMVAVAVKSAVFPFHYWIINTYTSISNELAVLFSATTTKIGVAGVLLLLPGIELEIVGGLIAVTAIVYTIFQKRYRKFLAYHIIGRIGFIVAGLGGQTIMAQQGGVYKIAGSIIYMSLLFMCARPIEAEKGNPDKKISLLSRPFLFVALLVGALSVVGIFPFGGYTGKVFLKVGLRSGYAVWLLAVADILAVISFTQFFYHNFTFKGQVKKMNLPSATKVSVFALMIMSIILGTLPHLLAREFTPPTGGLYRGDIIIESGLYFILGLGIYLILKSIIYRITCVFCEKRVGIFNFTRQTIFKPALDILQNIHNGNLQRYLIWVFTTLLLFWIYFFLQVHNNYFISLFN